MDNITNQTKGIKYDYVASQIVSPGLWSCFVKGNQYLQMLKLIK